MCGFGLYNLSLDISHDVIILYRHRLLWALDVDGFFRLILLLLLPILGFMVAHQITKLLMGSDYEIIREINDRLGITY